MQQRETAAIPKLVLSTAHRLLRRIATGRDVAFATGGDILSAWSASQVVAG